MASGRSEERAAWRRLVHTSTLKEKSRENGRPGRSMGARKMCTEIYITRNSIMPGAFDTLGELAVMVLVSEYRTACSIDRDKIRLHFDSMFLSLPVFPPSQTLFVLRRGAGITIYIHAVVI
ncbi:hypothetical protein WN55_09930 [Dufourea novaeangliae]|uniref:Uncharacterized protein n=1 Tax=Dufourea novaeangliae TaxID=178035 RepID=A0A154P9I2_DUFNO|nr:hypothetical protein WN55_09930 [Dufourea novaeangliae]